MEWQLIAKHEELRHGWIIAPYSTLPADHPVSVILKAAGLGVVRVINRHPKTEKENILCRNCRFKKEREVADNFKIFSKEEWLCLGFKIIDLLDGEVSYYTCRKARKDTALCGPDAQWFKVCP